MSRSREVCANLDSSTASVTIFYFAFGFYLKEFYLAPTTSRGLVVFDG